MSRLRPVPDAPRRGIGLVRVSKERVEMISPEIQRTSIEDYAARRGIVIVEWMEGLDESASRARSGWWARLDEATEKIHAGHADTIVVWQYSRAARHRLKWAVAIDKVETAGGSLESATEQVDARTSTGRFTRGMLAELAAFEAERIGETWKETQASRRARGLPHTGGGRFGYTYSRQDGYAVDPETGPVLADLYRRYADGEGVARLAAWLNQHGIRTRRGNVWDHNGVLRMLDSGFGAGLLVVGRADDWLDGTHPPVISRQEWESYRRQREAKRRLPARVRNPRYVLSGLLKCGECGGPMSAYSKPNRRQGVDVLYRCTRWQDSRVCPGTWVAKHRAEQAVLDWLRPLAEDVDERSAAQAAALATRTRAKVDAARLARQVAALDVQLNRLTVDLASGLVPPAAYAAARDEIAGRKAGLETALREAEADRTLRRPPAAVIRNLLTEWDTLPVGERHDLLRTMVERIEVRKPAVKGRGAACVVVPRWGA